MRPLLIRFLNDRSGATAIEYALVAIGVAMAIVAVIQALGATTAGQYQSVQDAFQRTAP